MTDLGLIRGQTWVKNRTKQVITILDCSTLNLTAKILLTTGRIFRLTYNAVNIIV